MRDWKFVAALVSLSLAVKIPIVLFLVQGYGIDESLYHATARDFANGGEFGVQTEFNDFRFVAPLLAFVMAGFYKVFGDSGPLLVSPILGSLTIVPFYYIGRSVFDEKGGRMAALLALFNPVFFLLNTRMLTESIGMFLLSVSIMLFIMSLKERRYLMFLPAAAVLTFIARYPYGFFLLTFIVVALIALVLKRKVGMIPGRDIFVGIGIAALVSVPWGLYNYGEFGNPIGGPLHQGSTDPGFDYVKASWYVPYLFIVSGATFPLMIYGLLISVKERKNGLYLLGFFCIFLLLFFVFGNTVEERYILPILPFSVIFMVFGYQTLSKSKFGRRWAKASMMVMIALNVIGAAYLTYTFSTLPKYSETREAVLWMKENCDGRISGNVFTPVYDIVGVDVVPYESIPEIDNQRILERGINCVIVSIHESPYKDAFRNDFKAEKIEFGKVIVYKIPRG